MIQLRFPFVFAVLFWLGASWSQAEKVDMAPVVRWIESQSKVKSFHGEFIQERKIRSLKSPIVKPGKVWFEQPSRARWQLGEDPGERIAIKNDQEVLVLQPKKKEAIRKTLDDVRGDDRLRGLTFLENGFPRTLEEFQKSFSVREVTKEDGYFLVDAKLRDGKASMAVLKMIFYIHEADYQMKAFRMEFRDKSSIYTRLTRLTQNAKIDPKLFRPDLSGYQVKTEK